MDWKEEAKLKFAERLLVLIDAYSDEKGTKLSLRQLAAKSNLEYSHVQRISKGQVDLALTTILALATGLEISAKELLEF
jgi:transcriptional regulator with XRE-family HTH domain